MKIVGRVLTKHYQGYDISVTKCFFVFNTDKGLFIDEGAHVLELKTTGGDV